jgi:hypothetical protein
MPYLQRVVSFLVLLFVGLLAACAPDDTLDVSNVEANVQIHRFDRAFFETDTSNFSEELRRLQNGEFAPFFSSQQSMSFWRHQRTVDFMVELAKESAKQYPDDNTLSYISKSLWKHYRYIFPDAPVDLTVYTYISGLDFDFPVIFVDSISTLFVSLDLFLGSDHPAYGRQADYLNTRHSPTYLPVEMAKTVMEPWVRRDPSDLTLLSEMIRFGKELYVLNKMLPDVGKEKLLRYNEAQLAFCKNNERMIWRFLLEQDMLFDQRAELKRRFTEEAPFSKFYMDFDSETPGRIGRWIGWQIVEQYMQRNPQTSLIELLQIKDHRKLFQESRYKP